MLIIRGMAYHPYPPEIAWCLLAKKVFCFLVFVLLLCPILSDVTGKEIAVIVKVIRSRRAHINELEYLLMELQ